MTTAPNEFAPWLGVFETVRVIDGVPLFVPDHRKELGRAMEALGLSSDFDFEQARVGLPGLSGRWRWVVTPEGTRTLFSEEETALIKPLALSVSPVRVGSSNWDARFKTVSYLSHVQAGKTASTPEVILFNEKGDVASAAHANIFWRYGEQLFTPAHEVGCRCGIVRRFVLQQREVTTGHFPLSDLFSADEIFLTNSMKGIVSVNEIKGRSLGLYPCADKLREEYEEEIARQVAVGHGQVLEEKHEEKPDPEEDENEDGRVEDMIQPP